MRKILTIIISFLLLNTYAQTNEPTEKQDTIKTTYLDEVIVSANKIPETKRTVAQQIKILTPTFINFMNAQTSADLLQSTGVVAMQRSQQGGGSPMMRGFEASRVLLVIDGIRMNNLIYRAGHLQNVVTIDNNMIDRVEISFGPSSTVYGSDALGGVVHFYTKNPELSKDKNFLFTGNAFTRFATANDEKTFHTDINMSGKKLGSLTSFTFSDFGDVKMGEKVNASYGQSFGIRYFYARRLADNSGDELVANSNPYVQKSTGYKQYDVMQKFLFAASDRTQHLINLQYSTSSNIPRYDRLTDPNGAGLRSAVWYYGPQDRLLASYQFKMKDLGGFADALTATASYQLIEESRHDRRFNSNNFNHRIENVDVSAITIDLQKQIGSSNLRYGFDSQFNGLKSTAYRINISDNSKTDLDTRYPDGTNKMSNVALYVTHTMSLGKNFTLNDGIRVGHTSLHSTFVNKTFFDFPFKDIDQKNTYASGNIGIIYSPTSWKISLMGSTGYRVPNIDDLAKVFESTVGSINGNGKLIVPNPDLKAEKTVNIDFGVTKFFGDKVRIEGVFFYTKFYDAIGVKATTFNGQSTVTYGGFPADVVSSQNVRKATIYGWNGQISANIAPQLVLSGSYNYTRGRAKVDGEPDAPLDHIAPQFGRVALTYSGKNLRTEWFCNFSGKKYLRDYSTSGEDNLQYAPAYGMPSWYTLNWRLSYEFNAKFTMQTGIDNILDLQYRTFASGINSPGRNLFMTLRVKF